MAITSIDQEMYHYFVQLKDAEKISVVQMIKTWVLERDSTKHITIEQYNKEIEAAEAEIENGDGFSQEEVAELSNGWLHGR